MATLKELVLEETAKGNVVFTGLEEPVVCKLEDFIDQPADGILYDLNLLPETILTLLNPGWVNKYAASQVIRALKERSE